MLDDLESDRIQKLDDGKEIVLAFIKLGEFVLW